MRLLVSDHSLVRMGDWHSELKQFVPMVRGPLDAVEAQKVINGLHVFLASLERGRPATFLENLNEQKKHKYPAHEQAYIFDRHLSDLYTMIWDSLGVTLVTVTWIQNGGLQILDEPHPRLRFQDVDQIAVPYMISPDLQGPDWNTIRTPAGRELELAFGTLTKKPGFWIQNKPEPVQNPELDNSLG